MATTGGSQWRLMRQCKMFKKRPGNCLSRSTCSSRTSRKLQGGDREKVPNILPCSTFTTYRTVCSGFAIGFGPDSCTLATHFVGRPKVIAELQAADNDTSSSWAFLAASVTAWKPGRAMRQPIATFRAWQSTLLSGQYSQAHAKTDGRRTLKRTCWDSTFWPLAEDWQLVVPATLKPQSHRTSKPMYTRLSRRPPSHIHKNMGARSKQDPLAWDSCGARGIRLGCDASGANHWLLEASLDCTRRSKHGARRRQDVRARRRHLRGRKRIMQRCLRGLAAPGALM